MNIMLLGLVKKSTGINWKSTGLGYLFAHASNETSAMIHDCLLWISITEVGLLRDSIPTK